MRDLTADGSTELERFTTTLSTEQRLVVDLFRGLLGEHSTSERVRAASTATGFDRELWSLMGRLGADRIALPDGGGSFVDAALVGIEVGRHIAPVPYAEVSSSVRLVDATGLGTDLPSGALVCAVENAVSTNPAEIAFADHLVVLAEGRAQLRAVRGGPPLANLGALPLSRPGSGATLVASVPVDAGVVSRWRNDRRILHAATLVGAGLRAVELTVAHVTARRQFDRPLGSFQVLQHRLADRITACRSAELLVHRAASYCDDAPARDYFSAVALSAARDAALAATREGVQMFGGYGYSVEYDIHLFLRYVASRRVLSGDALLESECGPATSWPRHVAV